MSLSASGHRRAVFRTAALLTAFLAGWMCCNQSTFASDIAGADTLSIEEIKMDRDGDGMADRLGDRVTVSGIVNVDTGLLHEVYMQIFIQNDDTGLSLFAESIRKPLMVGDSIVATGVVQQYFGLTEVKVEEYEIVESGTPAPAPIPLMEAVDSPSDYEGMLVKGHCEVVDKGNRYNGKFLTVVPYNLPGDSILVYVSNFNSNYSDFDFDALGDGDQIDVTGIMSQYDPDYPERSTFKIFLREPSDLMIHGITQSRMVLYGIGALIILLIAAAWIVTLQMRVKSKTSEIRQSLEEKEVLLREIHHRVKNNLAIVSGLIDIQMDESLNEETKKVLRDSQSRIRSMALVHDKLYRTSSLRNIGMQNYIRELVEALHSSFATPGTDISLEFDIDDIELDIDRTIPCGLLINELVVNAFKHAFENRDEGLLEVIMKQTGEGTIQMTVRDNGKGLPDDFDRKKRSSLGMMLIDTFKEQLGAEMEVRNGSGSTFIFTFPMED